MTENKTMMDILRSAGIDVTATLAVFVLLINRIAGGLFLVGIPVEYIPAVGAIAAACCGVVIGRALDWSREWYVKRRASRRLKKRSRYKLP